MSAKLTTHSTCSSEGAEDAVPMVSIRTHRGSGERQVTLEDLKRVAHLSQERAAAALNVGNTRFKSACRELGMRGWPYRKIKSVRSLLYAIQKEPDSVHPDIWPAILWRLDRLVDHHFHNPTEPLTEEFKVLRQAAYKRRHGQKRRSGDGAAACSSSEHCLDEDLGAALPAGHLPVGQAPCTGYQAFEDSAQSPCTPPNARERALRRLGPAGEVTQEGVAESGPGPRPEPPSADACPHAGQGVAGTPVCQLLPAALPSPSAPDLWCSLTWTSGLEFAPVPDEAREDLEDVYAQTASS
ncbi:hypothetical protein ACKKBG_A23670 [Auxenochlorella protothecoides x Auxenochlorella symbiontica]|uniref:Protein RKD1 n=2 Tax=Auxenochlorella protothecoides TaxID=3075 RepID=A0A087SAX0_AUXPR|nr:Protein RKD1 [Auxenochlorella protothecoides]KFM22874.1 Protein RKD1 [Auxenochlorella protothecoides]RMZ56472.1 hypothetical protein APUTEX25_001319 [Auxenochlorella protothecoides]|eukprot:RMZ56472.1 hypothetical protein APUTEX25_001319 [Auxenochlorella protothecoides]